MFQHLCAWMGDTVRLPWKRIRRANRKRWGQMWYVEMFPSDELQIEVQPRVSQTCFICACPQSLQSCGSKLDQVMDLMTIIQRYCFFFFLMRSKGSKGLKLQKADNKLSLNFGASSWPRNPKIQTSVKKKYTYNWTIQMDTTHQDKEIN